MVENTDKVQAARESTSVYPTGLKFELYEPSFLQSHDPALDAGKIKVNGTRSGIQLKSRLASSPDTATADSLHPSSWDGGFQSIWQEMSLLPLFHAMGGKTPKVMLEWAACSEQRWKQHVTERETTLQDAGLNAHLRELFSDERKLRQAIERLLSLSIIGMEDSGGVENYICSSELAQVSYEQNRACWARQALEVFCYAFSRGQTAHSL